MEHRKSLKLGYLVILGDLIDYSQDNTDVLTLINALLDQFPENIFCVHGNHETYFNTMPNLKDTLWYSYLRRAENCLKIQYGEKNIFCSHGGIPAYDPVDFIYLFGATSRDFDQACIFNANSFLNFELFDSARKSRLFLSYQETGTIIPNYIDHAFLKVNKMDLCVSGHIHLNQIIRNPDEGLQHVTICSSSKVHQELVTPSAFVYFNDEHYFFLNIKTFEKHYHFRDVEFSRFPGM